MKPKTKEELWEYIHREYCQRMRIRSVIDDMGVMEYYHGAYMIGYKDGKGKNDGNN